MQEIPDESALPGREKGGQMLYVRSKCDPTVLICGPSGDCFVRRDGAPWEHPGYRVDTVYDLDADRITQRSHEARAAYCDHETYTPKKRTAA